MPPTAAGSKIRGAPRCSPCPGPQWLNSSPPVLTCPQVLLIWHLLGMPGGSKRGLGQWAFLPRMTHIRNRAQTGVSGKGLPAAWLRPGAEAGGKCLEGMVGHWHTGCPRQRGRDRKDLAQGSGMHLIQGLPLTL